MVMMIMMVSMAMTTFSHNSEYDVLFALILLTVIMIVTTLMIAMIMIMMTKMVVMFVVVSVTFRPNSLHESWCCGDSWSRRWRDLVSPRAALN